MKKLLLFIFVLTASIELSFSQGLTNGDFENWNTSLLFNLDNYNSSNADALIRVKQSNCVQTSDAQNGNYAVRLETKVNNTDTAYGYFANVNIIKGKGGSPYSQSPSTINGYYKCDVKPGDSAFIVVLLKKAGVTISQNNFYFTGIKNTYTAFSFTLTPSSISPDSLIIGAASSNILKNKGIHGSVLQLDNLSFGGIGITQPIPNGNFENWTITNMEEPAGWSTKNLYGYRNLGIPQLEKITNAFSKQFAMQITTLMIEEGKSFIYSATTGKFTKTGFDHGQPFTNLIDTLSGVYKYMPSTGDTASINIVCYKNGVKVGGGYLEFSNYLTDYVPFKIPISNNQTPDSMRIDVASSGAKIHAGKVGSTFILDNLTLRSDPVNIYFYGQGATVSIFPNPVVNELHFNLKDLKIDELVIIDINGNTIETISVGGQQNMILDTRTYPSGNYFYVLTNNNAIVSRGKFSVVK